MYYEKLAILARLNEDLKEFQDEESYKETKRLIEENEKILLENEVKIEDYSEKVNEALRNEFTKECQEDEESKAKLTFSRWLSDGSLECEFIDINWETFTKVYQEDDIFARRQEEREEQKKAKIQNEEETFRRFWNLLPKGSGEKTKSKLNFFESLRAA